MGVIWGVIHSGEVSRGKCHVCGNDPSPSPLWTLSYPFSLQLLTPTPETSKVEVLYMRSHYTEEETESQREGDNTINHS